jgi:hypothetical protein
MSTEKYQEQGQRLRGLIDRELGPDTAFVIGWSEIDEEGLGKGLSMASSNVELEHLEGMLEEMSNMAKRRREREAKNSL